MTSLTVLVFMETSSVVYGHSSVSICGGATGSNVTGSDVSNVTGACATTKCTISALVGTFNGSDVTGSGPDRKARKYVLRMPGLFPRFFLARVVVQNAIQ